MNSLSPTPVKISAENYVPQASGYHQVAALSSKLTSLQQEANIVSGPADWRLRYLLALCVEQQATLSTLETRQAQLTRQLTRRDAQLRYFRMLLIQHGIPCSGAEPECPGAAGPASPQVPPAVASALAAEGSDHTLNTTMDPDFTSISANSPRSPRQHASTSPLGDALLACGARPGGEARSSDSRVLDTPGTPATPLSLPHTPHVALSETASPGANPPQRQVEYLPQDAPGAQPSSASPSNLDTCSQDTVAPTGAAVSTVPSDFHGTVPSQAEPNADLLVEPAGGQSAQSLTDGAAAVEDDSEESPACLQLPVTESPSRATPSRRSTRRPMAAGTLPKSPRLRERYWRQEVTAVPPSPCAISVEDAPWDPGSVAPTPCQANLEEAPDGPRQSVHLRFLTPQSTVRKPVPDGESVQGLAPSWGVDATVSMPCSPSPRKSLDWGSKLGSKPTPDEHHGVGNGCPPGHEEEGETMENDVRNAMPSSVSGLTPSNLESLAPAQLPAAAAARAESLTPLRASCPESCSSEEGVHEQGTAAEEVQEVAPASSSVASISNEGSAEATEEGSAEAEPPVRCGTRTRRCSFGGGRYLHAGEQQRWESAAELRADCGSPTNTGGNEEGGAASATDSVGMAPAPDGDPNAAEKENLGNLPEAVEDGKVIKSKGRKRRCSFGAGMHLKGVSGEVCAEADVLKDTDGGALDLRSKLGASRDPPRASAMKQRKPVGSGGPPSRLDCAAEPAEVEVPPQWKRWRHATSGPEALSTEIFELAMAHVHGSLGDEQMWQGAIGAALVHLLDQLVGAEWQVIEDALHAANKGERRQVCFCTFDLSTITMPCDNDAGSCEAVEKLLRQLEQVMEAALALRSAVQSAATGGARRPLEAFLGALELQAASTGGKLRAAARFYLEQLRELLGDSGDLPYFPRFCELLSTAFRFHLRGLLNAPVVCEADDMAHFVQMNVSGGTGGCSIRYNEEDVAAVAHKALYTIHLHSALLTASTSAQAKDPPAIEDTAEALLLRMELGGAHGFLLELLANPSTAAHVETPKPSKLSKQGWQSLEHVATMANKHCRNHEEACMGWLENVKGFVDFLHNSEETAKMLVQEAEESAKVQNRSRTAIKEFNSKRFRYPRLQFVSS
ncbi:hypothetical protein CYMTET_18843 [Cymbomonas tetramitiformis]|uniref:Uncharacterized protein n=1 Tax=Cymbomonas tetramitiformis TaxID=36881 RepID=A0AAE0L5U7_9CHLO|nr:hypothetical protein CYMTET_18843 [Cymbomonas tetramitiformis]